MHMSSDMSVAIREILSGRLSLWDYARSLAKAFWSLPFFAWDDPLPGLLDLPLFRRHPRQGEVLQRKKA